MMLMQTQNDMFLCSNFKIMKTKHLLTEMTCIGFQPNASNKNLAANMLIIFYVKSGLACL